MDQVRNMVDWTRRRKVIATVSIAATLVIGIFIGTLVNGKVSAMRTFSFAGTQCGSRWHCQIPFRRPTRFRVS